MQQIPRLVPISEIRQRQVQILADLHDGPTLLTQRGMAAAVLVSVEMWNAIAEELEDLRDVALVYAQDQQMAAGELEAIDVDLDELQAMIDEATVPA